MGWVGGVDSGFWILDLEFPMLVGLGWLELAMRWGKAGLDRAGESPDQLFQRVEWALICGTGPWGARREEGERSEYRKRSERYAERGARGDSLANVRSIGEVKARA